jgi:hypothetical protein
MKVNRRQVSEVTEGLVPALRRGLVRTGYNRSTLRETLLEFWTRCCVSRMRHRP